MPVLADLLEQGEVLHVAGADLEDVGVLGDQLDVARVHDLGDDGQARGLARASASSLQPLLPEPLERVRGGARLERAAAQDRRAGLALTGVAVSMSCSRLSTAHGPAMTCEALPAEIHAAGRR